MEVTQKPFDRKKPDQLVYLELGSGNGGMLLSISEEGFRFRAVSPVRPNGLMPFAFSFDGQQRLQGVGEVEWLDDDGKSGGMRFTEVSPEFRAALESWLAADSRRSRSDREGAPAAATPLDTMEKIREELRRGYPQRSSEAEASGHDQPDDTQRKQEKRETSSSRREAPWRPERQREAPAKAKPFQPTNVGDRPVAHRQADTRETLPAQASSAKLRDEQPVPRERPRPAPPTQQSQAFYPPPFTKPEEDEKPSLRESQAKSAFLRKPAANAASPDASMTSFRAPQTTDRVEGQSTTGSAANAAHSSADTLRRAFRGDPAAPAAERSRTDRPYIPPADESFDAAWERAKLTTPAEPPHLSRAAAGSIIGVALAVILGALAFNFRQDIGALIIDMGQRISGESRTSAPTTASSPADAQATGNPANSETTPATKPETAPSSNAAGPMDNAAIDKSGTGKANDAGGTNHGGSSEAAPHNSAAGAGSTRPANPAASRDPSKAPAQSALSPAATSAGSVDTNIGSEPGSGQDEFNTAREMLRSEHRLRDLAKAVDLLWAGVRKGYVPAEVTLADLYRRGEGVPKNCDQAQVLLVAASRKGSPEARQMLEQMAEEGCTD